MGKFKRKEKWKTKQVFIFNLKMRFEEREKLQHSIEKQFKINMPAKHAFAAVINGVDERISMFDERKFNW
jgi:hypothetical protein